QSTASASTTAPETPSGPLPASAPESSVTDVPAKVAGTDPVPEEVAAARGTTPAGLGRALAGDLDAIVLMAMRKEPDRRRGSARPLARDPRRHPAGPPTPARASRTP